MTPRLVSEIAYWAAAVLIFIISSSMTAVTIFAFWFQRDKRYWRLMKYYDIRLDEIVKWWEWLTLALSLWVSLALYIAVRYAR